MHPSAVTTSQVDPPTGGILSALMHLARPLSGEHVAPSIAGEPFRTVPGRFSGSRDLSMDLYLPAQVAGAPSCLLVHGGGFLIGHRAMKPIRIAAHQLVARGVAVASIDYRLLQHGGTLAEAVSDVTAALAHWRRRAEALGLDGARIGMAGFSAGAALTLLAAGRLAVEGAVEPAAVVSVYGPVDFSRVSGARAKLLARWITEARDPAAIRARSPIAHARFGAPLLVVHGSDDRLVAPAQARALVDERVAGDLATRHLVLEGAPHGFFAHEGSPWVEQAVVAMEAFLRAPRATR